MMCKTIGLTLTSGILAIPSWLYHKERISKKNIELTYKINIA